MPRERRASLVPTLYHILLTHTTPPPSKSGTAQPTHKISICGTYTSLPAAQAAAKRRLFDEGFSRKHFADLAYNQGQANWKWGEDVVVRAEGVDGEVVEVRVEMGPNSLGVRGRRGSVGSVGSPGGSMGSPGSPNAGGDEGEGERVEEELFYTVLWTVHGDGKWKDGESVGETEVRGIYLSRHAAVVQGRQELVESAGGEGGEEGFKEFEECGSAGEEGEDEVVVRAVGRDGTRYEVFVVGES
jgi:hypothetical protein